MVFEQDSRGEFLFDRDIFEQDSRRGDLELDDRYRSAFDFLFERDSTFLFLLRSQVTNRFIGLIVDLLLLFLLLRFLSPLVGDVGVLLGLPRRFSRKPGNFKANRPK